MVTEEGVSIRGGWREEVGVLLSVEKKDGKSC